ACAVKPGIGSPACLCRREAEPLAESTVAVPLVSVIIPTYRRPRLLVRAVRSVLDQTMRDLEVIVAADGADSETMSALSSFADVRLQAIVLTGRGGVSRARNAGVRVARGRW